MKFYIIAGEHSGDYIGSKVIQAIKSNIDARDEEIIFEGIGGRLIEQEGVQSLFPMELINIMGFVEILPNIIQIKKLINQTVNDIINIKPQLLITIDAPGFTYRVAEKVKGLAPNIKLVHIVAPSVWAYRANRAKKYAKIYHHLLTLLPFEPKYFTEVGLNSEYIGHPILEQDFFNNKSKLKEEMDISKEMKVICVTPGSRRGEIQRHMPVIREALDILSRTNNIKVIFVQSDEKNIQLISKYLDNCKFDYFFTTNRLKAFGVSDCAIAKSGTNTLEIAASGTPMIVGYKLHPASFWIIKMLIKIKFISLINIISDREIIPEYIQSDFNPVNIASALSDLLTDHQQVKTQINNSKKILKILGFGGNEPKPSEKAANIILRIIKN